MKPRRLAIIPARGGSKRIPRKNIKTFFGKPIILRVLDEVSASGFFGEIHVSTEDREITEIVSRAGYPPRFQREPELSGDDMPLSGVLRSVVSRYKDLGESFDTIALIFATAVLLDRRTLSSAVSRFEKGDTSVQMVSVAKYPVPVEWAMRMDEAGMLDPLKREKLGIRSQDLLEAWYETADFVLYDEQSIFSNDVHSPKRGFAIPYMSVDIDNHEDWELTRRIFTLRFSKLNFAGKK